MRLPDHFIAEVKSRVVLSDVMGRRHKVVRAGKSLKVCCPFHTEKTPSCHINDDQGRYYCFGCGAKGDAIEYLRLQENYSFYEAILYLAKEYGLPVPKPDHKNSEGDEEKSRREALYRLLQDVATWYEDRLWSSHGGEAQKYLERRSFTKETLSRFKVGFAPSGSSVMREFHQTRGVPLKDLEEVGLVITDSERGEPYDRFRGRLMFPILNKQGKVIGFGGRRLLSDKGPKYLNSPETVLFHKRNELYGHQLAAQQALRHQPLIVCEGYTDVMSLSQAGYGRAVAPLGTALTDTQITLLWRLSKEPILCFDGDIAGSRAAIRAAETALPLLTAEKTLRFLSLPEGEDPSSLLEKGGRDPFQYLLDNKCQPVVDILWRACKPAGPFKTPEDETKVMNKIYALTKLIQDPHLRKSYNEMLRECVYRFKRPQKNLGVRSQYRQKGAKGRYLAPLYSRDDLDIHRPSLNADYISEAILLYVLLHFPSLIRDYEEEIALFAMRTESLRSLKETLLEIINDHPDLDRDTLKDHLYQRNLKNVVDSLISPKVALHASFVHPDKPLEEVQPLFEFYLRSGPIEKQPLGDLEGGELSPESWQRIQYRRKMVASMVEERHHHLERYDEN